MNGLVHAQETPPLEVDPIQHMAVLLNRAKGWLEEAKNIDDVRAEKAVAVGLENYLREKELAFDAQLAATEIVRRCERRIGELIREGQRDGTIRTRGQSRWSDVDPGRVVDRPRTVGEVVNPQDPRRGYREHEENAPMADAPADQFEQAITEARDEGNLSRANVVRKVKGEPSPTPERSEWHRKKPHIDSNRILRTLAQELDALTSGLDLMEKDDLDPTVVDELVPLIRASLSTINRHVRRIS